jgi:hypothetical protein
MSKVIKVNVLAPWDSDLSKPEVAEAWAKVGKEIARIASEPSVGPLQWGKGTPPEGVRY